MKKKKETIAFGYYNTELCVNLKTILLNDPVMKMNMAYPGTLVKDGEEHFLFTSDAWMNKAVDKVLSHTQRNEHVFKGKYINMTVRDDGTPRLNFREVNWTAGFNIFSYAMGVMEEVTKALRKFNRMKREGLV